MMEVWKQFTFTIKVKLIKVTIVPASSKCSVLLTEQILSLSNEFSISIKAIQWAENFVGVIINYSYFINRN